MNKKSLSALCCVLLGSINAFANPLPLKTNFKKIYCGNQEFLGNSATKRPHLHCGESFLAYKKANGDHTNITDFGTCNRTNAVFDDIKSNKNAFADYQGIYNALVLFHQAGCPNQFKRK